MNKSIQLSIPHGSRAVMRLALKKPLATAVFMEILNYAETGNKARVLINSLAEATGRSARSIRRAISELVAYGFIRRTKIEGCNLYTLNASVVKIGRTPRIDEACTFNQEILDDF